MIDHVGGLPLEEALPSATGLAAELLAVRAWIMLRVRRGRTPQR